MPLGGPQIETITVHIKDAFDKATLAQLVRFKLGADMFKEWVPDNLPDKMTVFTLVTRLEEEGLLASFLGHVLAARPEKADLQKQIGDILSSMNGGTASSIQQVEAIKTGVEGMASKLNLAPLHQIVLASQDVLTELTGKIELLRAYKALHDALHIAKMHFRGLETPARLMASDPLAAGDFSQAVVSMETLSATIGAAIQELPAIPPAMRQEENEWLTRFNAAITIARQAADQSDPVTARQSVQGVRTILRTEPSRIDGKLSRAADEIDLSKLKEMFASAAALPQLAEDATMLEAGRVATEQLLRQVKAQIVQHSQWQNMDLLLSGADDIMRTSNAAEPWDFDALWKGIEENITALMVVEPQSEWVKRISPIVARVDDRRANNDWPKLAMEFSRYRQEATVQFFVVDTKLKTLAGEVNVIGAPLRNLLKQL